MTTGGTLAFFERPKFVVQLSCKRLGDAFLCRICTDVKRTPGHFFWVFVSFLALLLDVFLEPVFAEE